MKVYECEMLLPVGLEVDWCYDARTGRQDLSFDEQGCIVLKKSSGGGDPSSSGGGPLHQHSSGSGSINTWTWDQVRGSGSINTWTWDQVGAFLFIILG